ncbi:MAG: NADH-quinone oxidoreductase subunit NuoB [Myxococcales bacterium]|jgi:Ni,Fe-hydrogenase III small subunit/ferredoxin|nr:NADH-quinone oxidoreductase subunit NuoB [Myxococcales bacterium]
MLKITLERIRQGHHTAPYPAQPPVLPTLFRGRPYIDNARCPADCQRCVQTCPVGAISRGDNGLEIDLGRCLFCGDCARACPTEALDFSRDHQLAARTRDALIATETPPQALAALDAKMKRLFGRSLKLRQVSAGGCNACEADLNVLSTLSFDMARFGIQFVASPRHADGIVVTGPVSQNMRSALIDTWNAVPTPRLLIAAGACAIAGGPFAGSEQVLNGVGDLLPVDLYIPGCPPHPYTTLDGLLRLLGRIESHPR